MRSDDKILLAHGGGGVLMNELIREHVLANVGNETLNGLTDSAVLGRIDGRLAFTTDSFVVRPTFFPGGDIGHLAVCGTANDLAAVGAKPLWLSLGLIIEEGVLASDLTKVMQSIAACARDVGMQVATGDTKVVEHGAADGIFVNTAGIGIVAEGLELNPAKVQPGDVVLVSGTLGDHAVAVVSKREGLAFGSPVESDAAPLWPMLEPLLEHVPDIRCMRDPTRGGLAAVLHEIASTCGHGVDVREADLPVKDAVRGACDLLGFDVLNAANEGKMVVVCPAASADAALETLRGHPLGRDAALVGRFTERTDPPVVLETAAGGRRLVEMPYGEELPRIC
jgi:hydrogenase expression/formation protein HypE